MTEYTFIPPIGVDPHALRVVATASGFSRTIITNARSLERGYDEWLPQMVNSIILQANDVDGVQLDPEDVTLALELHNGDLVPLADYLVEITPGEGPQKRLQDVRGPIGERGRGMYPVPVDDTAKVVYAAEQALDAIARAESREDAEELRGTLSQRVRERLGPRLDEEIRKRPERPARPEQPVRDERTR